MLFQCKFSAILNSTDMHYPVIGVSVLENRQLKFMGVNMQDYQLVLKHAY